jgi:hypothetical protein
MSPTEKSAEAEKKEGNVQRRRERRLAWSALGRTPCERHLVGAEAEGLQ